MTDRLTALDASFLWFERLGVPIHVGAVATFEAGPLLDGGGTLRLGDLRAHIGTRISEMPRLRRRLATVPFDLDRPHWIDDPDFDVARHVGEVRVPPPGDDAALRRLAGRLQSEVLPRDRPLWDLRFVTGLAGDRVGLIERVHHALVDGVSGVDLATVLLDLEPDAPAPPPSGPWSPPPSPDRTTRLADALRDRAGDPVRATRRIVRAARRPADVVRVLRTVGSGIGALVGDGILAPRTSFNRAPEGGRQLAWVRAPLDQVRTVATAAGGTVNDVVLSAVAGGLRGLLIERGERLPTDLVLKVLVPVSMRRDDEHGALGNRVGAIYAPLPVGLGDPEARLAAVTATTRRLKERAEGPATALVLDAANVLPAVASRLMAKAVEHRARREPRRHQRSGAARPALRGGSQDARRLPRRAAGRQPRGRRRRALVRRHAVDHADRRLGRVPRDRRLRRRDRAVARRLRDRLDVAGPTSCPTVTSPASSACQPGPSVRIALRSDRRARRPTPTTRSSASAAAAVSGPGAGRCAAAILHRSLDERTRQPSRSYTSQSQAARVNPWMVSRASDPRSTGTATKSVTRSTGASAFPSAIACSIASRVANATGWPWRVRTTTVSPVPRSRSQASCTVSSIVSGEVIERGVVTTASL